MSKIFESTIEEFVIELLQNQGWQYLAPEKQELERLFISGETDLTQVVLKSRLKRAIETINPAISEEAYAGNDKKLPFCLLNFNIFDTIVLSKLICTQYK